MNLLSRAMPAKTQSHCETLTQHSDDLTLANRIKHSHRHPLLNTFMNYHISTNPTAGLGFRDSSPTYTSCNKNLQRNFFKESNTGIDIGAVPIFLVGTSNQVRRVEMFIPAATEHRTQQIPSRRLRKFGNYVPRAQSKSPKKMAAPTDHQTSSA